jgi:hypothetical protein
MMVRAVHGAPRPIGLATLRVVCSVAPSCQVIVPSNRTYEWSVTRRHTVVWHCCRLSARLACHDNFVCPHVLQAPR